MKITENTIIRIGDQEAARPNTLQDALSVAPGWSQMFISRHENGWVFISVEGIRYHLDTGKQGRIPWTSWKNNSAVYEALGRKLSEIYVENLEWEKIL